MTKSWLKTRKRKNGNRRYFFHKSPSNRWFSLISRADARKSADVIYRMWRIPLLCRLSIVIDVKKYCWSRREYLMPTDNIILLDHFFNLATKSNPTGRLLCIWTHFFDNLVVAYFSGPPCTYAPFRLLKRENDKWWERQIFLYDFQSKDSLFLPTQVGAKIPLTIILPTL